MNIKEAKEEIIHTVQAYLRKDDSGAFEIPVEKQRPIFMLGAPGIGKTAIMEQIADELHINLISYTITHHTRQSAIGLPYISKKNYGEEEYSVTEYTMSEIIASVYESIERSGISEGILFLDEINCVSETLAPTMLQFLQYKTFGMHQVPEGFVIVTAGNPPEYNKSVRDFDIATLDRLRKITIEEDFSVWKEYAYEYSVHGAIIAYLEIKKDHFYRVQQDVDGKRFVTGRSWEDLSRILLVYEEMQLPITEDLVAEYIADREIARDFTLYYELYNKYRNVYHIPDIFEGQFPENHSMVHDAAFDEKLSLLSLLVDGLNQEFKRYGEDLEVHRGVFQELKLIREKSSVEGDVRGLLHAAIDKRAQEIKSRKKAKLLGRKEERILRLTQNMLEEFEKELILKGNGTGDDFQCLKSLFASREEARQNRISISDKHLTNSFSFISRYFGEGQELVIFLSELSSGYYSLKFVTDVGNEAYFKYNRYLLLQDRKQELKKEIEEVLKL